MSTCTYLLYRLLCHYKLTPIYFHSLISFLLIRDLYQLRPGCINVLAMATLPISVATPSEKLPMILGQCHRVVPSSAHLDDSCVFKVSDYLWRLYAIQVPVATLTSVV